MLWFDSNLKKQKDSGQTEDNQLKINQLVNKSNNQSNNQSGNKSNKQVINPKFSQIIN